MWLSYICRVMSRVTSPSSQSRFTKSVESLICKLESNKIEHFPYVFSAFISLLSFTLSQFHKPNHTLLQQIYLLALYFVTYPKKDSKAKTWGRLTRSRYVNTIINHDTVYNVLCAAGPSVKSKVLALPQHQVKPLILKNQHNTTRRHSYNRKFTPMLNQKSQFPLCKLSAFVNKTFRDFVKITLRHESYTVTRVESLGKKRDFSRVFTTSFLTVAQVTSSLKCATRVSGHIATVF